MELLPREQIAFQRMLDGIRQTFERRFTARTMAKHYVALYERLLRTGQNLSMRVGT